jgi:hypothetical protein
MAAHPCLGTGILIHVQRGGVKLVLRVVKSSMSEIIPWFKSFLHVKNCRPSYITIYDQDRGELPCFIRFNRIFCFCHVPVRFCNCSYGAVVIGFFLEMLFRWNKPGIPVIRFFIVFPILLIYLEPSQSGNI